MRIATPHELGRYVRERRLDRGETQAAVAAAAGVSRRWLANLEAGKPTAEIGLVFRTLAALDLLIDARPTDSVPGHFDLDQYLRTLSGTQDPTEMTVPPSDDGGDLR